MRKQLAAAGLTAGLAVGGVAGFAFTSGSSSVGAQDGTTTTVATAPKGERPDPSTRIADALAPLVADGTITQAQADKVTQALLAARPDGGPGGRHGGDGRHGGPGLDAAATALGITVDDLRAELQKGSSIADVAKAKGVDVSKVTDALVAEATKRIDERVAAGKMTQAQADERLAQIKDRITAMVDGKLPEGGPGFGGPGFGGPGMGGRGHGPGEGHDDDSDGAPGAPGPDGSVPTTTQG